MDLKSGTAYARFGNAINPVQPSGIRHMKRAAIISGLILAGLVGLLCFIHHVTRPPSEAKLLRIFHDHRTTFDQLHDMVEMDTNLSRLAEWGVEIDNGAIFRPPNGNFPADRFNRYLALLKEAQVIGIGRGNGAKPELMFLTWASGFAGDTVHVAICWENVPLERQTASMDEYYRTHHSNGATYGWVYQHIEGNWYLGTDLWSE